MKKCLWFFIVWSLVISTIALQSTSAQEACGVIIEVYDGEEYQSPIDDCGDPFSIGEENQNVQVSFGNEILQEGGSYPFLNSIVAFSIAGVSIFDEVSTALYKHQGNDYVLVEQHNAVLSYMFDTAGMYTLVVGQYPLPEVSQNIFERFLTLLTPTAYATYPGPTHSITFQVIEEKTGASNILFLPGIQSSRLYKEGVLGTEDQLWEPNNNTDVSELSMTETGKSTHDIYTRDIIGKAMGIFSVYDGFAQFLDGLVDEGVIENWKPFAYDWRYSVTDVAELGTQYEDAIRDAVSEIEALAQNSFSGKVTLIGHSNGGLLAKAVMQRLEREGKVDLVDTVILLASPQLGTPKAVATLLHGYDQERLGGLLIDDEVARDVIRNMPGVYGLLPSEAYLDARPQPLVTFDTSESTEVFRNAYGDAIETIEELEVFMSGNGDGRPEALTSHEAGKTNEMFFNTAQDDHAQVLDSWIAPDSVRVVEVVGIGLVTIRGFGYTEFTERVCNELGTQCGVQSFYKPKPYMTMNGDQTVIVESAEAYGGTKETYYVDLKKIVDTRKDEAVTHADISENKSVQDLIQAVIGNVPPENIPFIDTTRTTYSDEHIILGAHSPVSIEVVDSVGRRVGLSTSSEGTPVIIEDIPGSSYVAFGDSIYIVLPADLTYDVILKGKGHGGLTFTTDTLSGETQTPISSAVIATVTPSTTVSVSYTEKVLSNIFVDVNGDTIVDTELTPQGEAVSPKGSYAVLRKLIKELPLRGFEKRQLLVLVSLAEKFDAKKRFVRAEIRMLGHIEKVLKYYVKKKTLKQAQIDPILLLISKLK